MPRVISAAEGADHAPAGKKPHHHNGRARKLTAHGLTMTLHQWHLATGLPMTTLYYRLQAGWPPEEVVDPDSPRRSGAPIKHRVGVGGETLTLREVAERAGVTYGAILKRRMRGEPPERLAGQFRYAKTYQYNGESLTLREWAQRQGMDERTLRWRLAQGWTVGDALTSPAYVRRGSRATQADQH